MCLTVGRQSRDHRPLSRDPSATFFKKFPNCLKRPKNVVWQSADGRVTSDHCRVTVQRLFSKFSQIAWNVQKTLFDSRPTVAWPPTTVAWPFSDFFQNFPKSLETSKKRCLTVGRRSRDLNHCRVTVQRLFSKFSQIAWNVQKTLFDSRPTVAWPPTTVAWPFSDFFQNFPKFLIAWNVQKTLLTVGRRSRDLDHCRVTVQRLFSKFFQIAWQSADGRVTSTTVAWPFSDFFQNFPKSLETSKKRCLTVGRRSRDLRPLSRDRSATFFKIFPKSLETSKKRCLTVGRRSRDLRPLSRDRSATFFKKISNCLKRRKIVVWQSADGRVTSDHSRTTFFKIFPITYCLADVYLVLLLLLLLLSFRQKLVHVSPPTGMVRSWKFRHHIKARDRTKRISDFGGKIPTR